MEATTIGRENNQVNAPPEALAETPAQDVASWPRISKYLIISVLVWFAATVCLFIGEASGLSKPPIGKDAMMSLTMIYLPVFLLVVLLQLWLTRERPSVDWENVFGVNKATARLEVVLVLAYLIATQMVLGLVFNIGLHFPGTDVYETGSHKQNDVWIWASVNVTVYVVLPMMWLCCRSSFSMAKLFSSLKWRRDLWIIFVYWCLDFFGPIVFGAAPDFFGLTFTQYLGAIPLGIFVNTLGCGLPVVVMQHILFLPRIAVLCPVQKRSFHNKMVDIALSGLFYALFSLFDQGVKYSSVDVAFMSFWYIISTQMLVGMGKAAFTVVTGNPFIHYITLHVISARIPFDTRMYAEIFNIK